LFAKSKVRACVDWHVRTLLISLDRRVARINKRMLFFPFSSATRSRLLELLKKMNGSQWKRKSQPLTIKKSLLNCAFTVIYTFEYVSYLRSYSNTTLNATFKFATYAVFFGLTLLRKFKLKRFSTRTYFTLSFSVFFFFLVGKNQCNHRILPHKDPLVNENTLLSCFRHLFGATLHILINSF
jgi:hypothetical protein